MQSPLRSQHLATKSLWDCGEHHRFGEACVSQSFPLPSPEPLTWLGLVWAHFYPVGRPMVPGHLKNRQSGVEPPALQDAGARLDEPTNR